MMGGSSSSSATTQQTEDSRVAVQDQGIGVSADGPVSVHFVADEAFELGAAAISELANIAGATVQQSGQANRQLGDALDVVTARDRADSAQLSEQIVQIGIPAAVVALIALQFGRR